MNIVLSQRIIYILVFVQLDIIMKKSEIQSMRNLGPVSERMLNSVNIYTRSDLEKVGAQGAFKLMQDKGLKPSKNALYAMIGALSDKSWFEVVKAIKYGRFD